MSPVTRRGLDSHRIPENDGTMMRMLVLTLAACCLPAVSAEEDQDSGSGAGRNWPQWRGPLGTGVAPHANPPLEWGESKNIRWKTAIPGSGHSTPIVWADRIFLTAAVPFGDAVEPRPDNAPGAHDNVLVTRRHRFVVLINRLCHVPHHQLFAY